MRIVHLIFGLNVGGAETMLMDVVREQSLDADVHVVVINREHHSSVLNAASERVGIVHIDRPVSSRNPWYFFKLHRVLRRLKPDILHTHNQSIIEMIPTSRVPAVTTIHATRIELNASILKYRSIFAISEAVKDDVLGRYPGLNVPVVHDGVDFSGIRQKKNYGGIPFRVVQIGRLDHPIKGQDIILEALHYVNDKIGKGALVVDFIGDGESRRYLEGLAAELGVAQWCRFLGLHSRQETYELLPNYDLLVQPSRHEGFGLTVVEGMAAGVPVLVSDIEGPMEIIDGGRYGFSFRCGDFRDCGDRLIGIVELSREPGMARRMSEARDHAKRRFNITLTAGRYMEEYKKVVSSGSAKGRS